MTRDEERKAFEAAISADPYDTTLHKVYADWLDEYGADRDADLAAEQRAWTEEKQDAIDWLVEYAREMEMTYEELIQVTNRYLDSGEGYTLSFDTPDRVHSHNDEFWKMYELATSQEVDENNKRVFFSCAC